MPGPPPQPAHLRLIRGNPSKRRVPREPEPEVLQQLPEPPQFLSEDAKGEWRRIIGEMVRLKLVTSLDTMLFACYCQSFSDWKSAVVALGKMAEKDAETHGLLIKDRGETRQNPLVRVVRAAGDHMLHCAAEFGLTPVARARIAGAGFEPPGGSPSKFDGLLA
jgi:P27 family predicted phage terminase small subunit